MNFDKFKLSLFEQYEQIAIFVQRNNDLDTCSCACSITEAINTNFEQKKHVSIIGIHGNSRFLTEGRKYKDLPIDGSKEVLVVLSEVSSTRQIDKKYLNDIKNAHKLVILDHHKVTEEERQEWIDLMGSAEKIIEIVDGELDSVCQVLYRGLKEGGWKINQRMSEMMFLGIYGDTKRLMRENIKPQTLRDIAELVELGVDIGKITQNLTQKPMSNLKVFAECIRDSIHEGNMLCLTLNPKVVNRHIPVLFTKVKKGGRILQNSILSYIPRGVEDYAQVNTIVFIHYSLYKPFDATKRFVYIQLVKENPALEHILREYGFKQNRNRGSREMNFYNLTALIEQYKSIFTL